MRVVGLYTYTCTIIITNTGLAHLNFLLEFGYFWVGRCAWGGLSSASVVWVTGGRTHGCKKKAYITQYYIIMCVHFCHTASGDGLDAPILYIKWNLKADKHLVYLSITPKTMYKMPSSLTNDVLCFSDTNLATMNVDEDREIHAGVGINVPHTSWLSLLLLFVTL